MEENLWIPITFMDEEILEIKYKSISPAKEMKFCCDESRKNVIIKNNEYYFPNSFQIFYCPWCGTDLNLNNTDIIYTIIKNDGKRFEKRLHSFESLTVDKLRK